MTTIEWRKCPSFPSYFISNTGRVFSLKTGKILNPAKQKGYYIIWVAQHGKRRQIYVHRMVLDAFIGPSELFVNHIDGNRSNNNLENLEYCTQKENIRHAYRIGLIPLTPPGIGNPASKLSKDDVFGILELLKKGQPQRKIGEIYGVSQRCVQFIKQRQTYIAECKDWDDAQKNL